MRWTVASILLAALALAAAWPALGFESVPPRTSAHDDITKDAAEQVGLDDGTIRALMDAVREPDYEETELDPDADDVTRIDANEDYQGAHHCDRVVGTGTNHTQTFAATTQYIDTQRRLALTQAAAGDGRGAVSALGRALHALQDCHSHSNVVDLSPAAQGEFRAALLGNGSAPDGLLLTGFDPGADDPGRPEGDPYPHDEFAKDGPDASPEASKPAPGSAQTDGNATTKFEAARALATDASRDFLEGALGAMDSRSRDAVDDADADPVPERLPVPATPVLFVGAALGLAAAAWGTLRNRAP